MRANTYAIDLNWRALLADVGIDPAHVLKRAALPEDLFTRAGVRLESADFFRLWEGLEAEFGDPLLPIRLADATSTEAFSPTLFAALCSPNFKTASERISHFKPLVAPIALTPRLAGDEFALTLRWIDRSLQPPVSLVATDLVFFVCLARTATRYHVIPKRVVTPRPPAPLSAYRDYFGVEVTEGPEHQLVFTREDALRPFLTFNEGMWSVFEPELRRRLAELDADATIEQRVRAVLLEALPSGQGSMDVIARKLALSKRTLQRRLKAEGTSFQAVLNTTREALAKHYLQRTQLSASEISFLLGFEEPNSFYRAFNRWTGVTPDTHRQRALAS